MSGHTPEPWVAQRQEIGHRYGCYGWEITKNERRSFQPPQPSAWDRQLAFLNSDDEETQANAARIVECVNGCAGLNPEAVAGLLAVVQSAIMHIELYQQRGTKSDREELTKLVARARAAVRAAAEGGAA